jgi:hypothetical protein
MSTDSPVEDYLDELFGCLRGDARQVRRALSEVEEHLWDATAQARHRGLDQRDAELLAVAQFGPAPRVAADWAPQARWRQALHRLGRLAPVGGVALVAVGLSGVLARVMGALWSTTFVWADSPGTRFPAADCTRWEHLHPTATTCAQAYLDQASADGFGARVVLGLLGVAVLVASGWVARRHRRTLRALLTTPAAALTGAVAMLALGTVLFAVAIARLAAADGHGAGQWLSFTLVALPVGAAFLATYLRRPEARLPWRGPRAAES